MKACHRLLSHGRNRDSVTAFCVGYSFEGDETIATLMKTQTIQHKIQTELTPIKMLTKECPTTIYRGGS